MTDALPGNTLSLVSRKNHDRAGSDYRPVILCERYMLHASRYGEGSKGISKNMQICNLLFRFPYKIGPEHTQRLRKQTGETGCFFPNHVLDAASIEAILKASHLSPEEITDLPPIAEAYYRDIFDRNKPEYRLSFFLDHIRAVTKQLKVTGLLVCDPRQSHPNPIMNMLSSKMLTRGYFNSNDGNGMAFRFPLEKIINYHRLEEQFAPLEQTFQIYLCVGPNPEMLCGPDVGKRNIFAIASASEKRLKYQDYHNQRTKQQSLTLGLYIAKRNETVMGVLLNISERCQQFKCQQTEKITPKTIAVLKLGEFVHTVTTDPARLAIDYAGEYDRSKILEFRSFLFFPESEWHYHDFCYIESEKQ